MTKPTKLIIKDLRRLLFKSQKEFAKKLGISIATISYYERLQRYPRREIAYKILDIAHKSNIPLKLEDLYPRP